MTTPYAFGLTALAAALAAALCHRERSARRRAERFAAAGLETLLNAIGANDRETGAHVRRVASYALALGDAAGLDEEQCRSVERVALFHDIGKIHEALFDIIHEDSRLTPDERRAVATHPARGAEVLAPLAEFYPDLAEGVLSHHERWDGTGYPRGLAGTTIPLNARIVSIADTFDAVTHRRRYRAARGASRGAEVIAEGRGTQFDPTLVDLFLLPPVFRQIERLVRETQRPRRLRSDRRARSGTRGPDISFRWRR